MSDAIRTTIVTAGDRAFAWGALLLVASMRHNGMMHPVVVGTTGWTPEMKRQVSALGGVTIRELEPSRMCVTCQKPMLMCCDDVKTDWVCWADADGMFIGDCSEWLTGDSPDEIVIRKYDSVPPDFTKENLEIWRKDIERHFGSALSESRYNTRFNAPFIIAHRRNIPFLQRWQTQIGNVLPSDVEIIMKKGSAYYQTDESVLGSLLCFDPKAPLVANNYKANGSVDKNRYYAHFAYNPKPWQMWNRRSMIWHDNLMQVVDWLVAERIVAPSDLPLSLRRGWWPLFRSSTWAAPWVWRAIKLKRRLLSR